MQEDVAIVQPQAIPPAPAPKLPVPKFPVAAAPPPPTAMAYTNVIPAGMVTDVVPALIVCCKRKP